MKITKINYIEPIAELGRSPKPYKFRYKRTITIQMYINNVTATITHLKECLYNIELTTNTVSDRTQLNIEVTTDECVHPLWVLRELAMVEQGLFLTLLKYDEVPDNVYMTNK